MREAMKMGDLIMMRGASEDFSVSPTDSVAATLDYYLVLYLTVQNYATGY
jgi:hypothetical protein